MSSNDQRWYEGLPAARAAALQIEILDAAVDWQYLTAKAGGMARKSDLDRYLIERFGLSEYDARGFSNQTEIRNDFCNDGSGLRWIAIRPEPTGKAA